MKSHQHLEKSHQHLDLSLRSAQWNVLQFQAANLVTKEHSRIEPSPSSIYIVGTGGTIAGTAASATAANYAPSQLSVEQVIAAIPAITDFEENIHASNLFQVNSEDMTSQLWLQLAKRVNTLLASPDVK